MNFLHVENFGNNSSMCYPVTMAWKKANNEVAIAPQKLVKAERKGYTLVEWGGCEVVENSINNKFE